MRLLNSLIDGFLLYLLSIPFSYFFISSAPTSETESLASFGALFLLYPIQIAIALLYYVISESFWQRTPAKFITRTKVVMMDGTKPSFGTILLRTVVRWVPLEALSFVGRGHPAGWHDRWSHTFVVPHSYTEADVRGINLAVHKTRTWIIVLLVVGFVLIPVVGILSSVVLASFNSAREKGRDAIRVADVKQLQLGLELYYDAYGTYPQTSSELVPEFLEGIPVDPTTNIPYSYATCSATSYHIGASLETQSSALLEDNDLAPMCEADPTNGTDESACSLESAGVACFDVAAYDPSEVPDVTQGDVIPPSYLASDPQSLACQRAHKEIVDEVVDAYKAQGGTVSVDLYHSPRLQTCVAWIEQKVGTQANQFLFNPDSMEELGPDDMVTAIEDYATITQ